MRGLPPPRALGTDREDAATSRLGEWRREDEDTEEILPLTMRELVAGAAVSAETTVPPHTLGVSRKPSRSRRVLDIVADVALMIVVGTPWGVGIVEIAWEVFS